MTENIINPNPDLTETHIKIVALRKPRPGFREGRVGAAIVYEDVREHDVSRLVETLRELPDVTSVEVTKNVKMTWVQ